MPGVGNVYFPNDPHIYAHPDIITEILIPEFKFNVNDLSNIIFDTKLTKSS